LPAGFEPLWFVGDSDIFFQADVDGRPAIALRADASADIVRRPLDLTLTSGASLEWTRRVNTLPSRVREDTFGTLVDNGRAHPALPG
jgi:hypothetical protein